MHLDLETLKPTLIQLLLEYLEYCWIRQKCLQYLLFEVFVIFIQDVG